MDFTPLNKGMLALMGETVQVSTQSGQQPMTAAYRGPWSGATTAGISVDRPDHELLCDPVDISSLGIARQTEITVRGTVLTVADIQPDDAGLTLLTLRAY